jgi:hypothetical protein
VEKESRRFEFGQERSSKMMYEMGCHLTKELKWSVARGDSTGNVQVAE